MTVRQIAELAKVSPATVSLVLNNKPGVSAQRRREIQKLLEDNGFTIKYRKTRALKAALHCKMPDIKRKR